MKVQRNIRKCIFLNFYLSTVHISKNNVICCRGNCVSDFNMYVRFQVCNLHSERDIHVQKIKVKIVIFEYVPQYFTDSAVHFDQVYVIRKVTYAVLYALNCIYLSLEFIL